MMIKDAMALPSLAIVVVLLTGCGGIVNSGNGTDFASQSANRIVAQAMSATRGLRAAHLVGEARITGQLTEFDLRESADGNCDGTLRIAGAAAELRGVHGITWVRPSNEYWTSVLGFRAQRVIGLAGDRWVLLAGKDGEDALTTMCDLEDGFLHVFLSELTKDRGTNTKRGTEVVDGQRVVVVESTSRTKTNVAYIRVDEPHYFVKMTHTAANESGSITVSQLDQAVSVQAPAAANVWDLSKQKPSVQG